MMNHKHRLSADSRTVRAHAYGPLQLCILTLAFACRGAPKIREGSASDADMNNPQTVFWAALGTLCDQSFEGRVVESEPPDPSFDTQRMVMHVRECNSDTIRIPFYVGEDRSRTWVLTRTASGIRLKHDHRHEDGSEDEVTQYGGDTNGPGSPGAQEFYADSLTGQLVPAASSNVWAILIEPSRQFSYALRREGATRRFRVDFDLRQTVETPPPPWGS